MEGKKECNILLTAYSTIASNLYVYESEDYDLKDLEYKLYDDDEHGSFMKYALLTSESVLKYLVFPKKNKDGFKPIQLDKVFAFTTDDINSESDNGEPKTYKLNGTEKNTVYQHVDDIKTTEFKIDKDFIDERLRTVYKYAGLLNKTEYPKLDIQDIHIKDETQGIEKNVENIFKMIDKVIQYIEEREKNKQEVKVYVDITGGFRTIPVYLLFVLNVLEKRGIEVEKILYTQTERGKGDNPGKITIDDLTPILKTQNFINGIHEFIKFGSAQALTDYFKEALKLSSENIYEPQYNTIIEGVVDSVEAFAEAITISNRAEFEKAMQKIKDAWGILDDLVIESIDDSDGKNEVPLERFIENRNLRLLKVFSPKIKEEYKDIWPLETGESRNGLDYIDWCLQHNFIQQALTLYIEVVPEILLDNANTKGILGFVRKNKRVISGRIAKKVKRNHKQSIIISKIPDRLYESTKDDLKKIHKSGKSEYKFLYWLLNQYTGNIDSQRKTKISEEISQEKEICKEALKKYSSRNLNEFKKFKWDKKDNENVDSFFENIREEFNYDLTRLNANLDFNSQNMSWNLCTLKVDEFYKNWKWIINVFSDKKNVKELCINTINILSQIIDSNTGKLNRKKDEGMVDALKKVINEQSEYKFGKTRMSRTELLFGFFYLKKKLKDIMGKKIIENYHSKLEETKQEDNEDKYAYRKNLNDIYDKIKLIELLDEALGEMKEYIEALPEANIHTVRKEYFKESDFGGDDLIEITLPFDINGIGIREYPKLVKAITSLDRYSKVDDIESLIENKELIINNGVLEALEQKKDEFRTDAKAILERIQSITGNDLEKAEKIADRYLRIIPESVGGKASNIDIWGRDALTLLILRTLLYPYNTLKLIRNDSVHAREKRNLNVTRKEVAELIKQSIKTIEKYLKYCK